MNGNVHVDRRTQVNKYLALQVTSLSGLAFLFFCTFVTLIGRFIVTESGILTRNLTHSAVVFLPYVV